MTKFTLKDIMPLCPVCKKNKREVSSSVCKKCYDKIMKGDLNKND